VNEWDQEVNTDRTEFCPVVSPDGRYLYIYQQSQLR